LTVRACAEPASSATDRSDRQKTFAKERIAERYETRRASAQVAAWGVAVLWLAEAAFAVEESGGGLSV
jgi:hypothetical protein